MANLSFDFNKVKRSFMTVTLKDNRKLIVKMPMKKTFEKLSALQEMDTDSMTAEDAMDTLGGLCAEILSHNMMLSRLVDTFFSRTSWTMLLYAENHSISVA